MRISVFGLGYVGSVTAACLARQHHVIGVDIVPEKVDAINEGRAPMIETGLGELVQAATAARRLRATTDGREAVLDSELSMVCVGTPSHTNGDLGVAHLEATCQGIGAALADKAAFHLVVIRSTVLPGTLRNLVIPALEAASGKRCGIDFGVCNNPEFLRESTAIHDYDNPPKTVIGADDPHCAELLAGLYRGLPGPLLVTATATAEMVKYADNAWHAVKVTFANEIGVIAKACGIDSHEVMAIFCEDTKLNLSPYYLRPGYAFGGSCLPKDVRALCYAARRKDLDLPLLSAVLPSNERHIQRGVDLILSQRRRRIGVLGFSFKSGTDDLRESPLVQVIETLIGKGFDLRIYDRDVSMARLMGSNREYILHRIPHISCLMVDSMDEVLRHAEVIVVGNRALEFEQVRGLRRPDQVIVDLVRVAEGTSEAGTYEGICW